MKSFVIDKISDSSKRCKSPQCPCVSFQDQFMGLCKCGAFRKIPADYIIYGEESDPETEILARAIRQTGRVYVISDEYTEIRCGVAELPLLMVPSGVTYKLEEALGYIREVYLKKNVE